MSALSVLFLVLGVQLCASSNILLVSTVASHSHSIWCNKLAELLVKRGHMVTVLDTDLPRKKMENLTTHTLEGGYVYSGKMDYQKVSKEDSPKEGIDFLYSVSLPSCRNMMQSPTLKKFVKEHSNKKKPFDLIIQDVTNCECFLGLVPTLGNPKLVLVTAFGETPVLNLMGSEGHIIHSPSQFSSFSHPMSFVEKLKNLYYGLHNYYVYRNYANSLDGYSKVTFGKMTPHILDIARTASVGFVNAHPILDSARYYSPAIIHIPGFHIDEPKKLDDETQNFLDDAKDGAIYFSLGTNVQSSMMSADRIEIFLNVFRKLKQKVLWKFEAPDIKSLPENVKISKWFSQNDVLAHPNIKLFITHCGLMSTQEAIYHGIPIVSMPFFMDQHALARKLSHKGVAVPLSYAGLSESTVQHAIEEVLTNNSYSLEIKRWSKVFRDRPLSSKDLAVFWIEHVLRNDDHKYLRPPETFLSSFELLFFDLKTIVGIVLGSLIVFIARFCKQKNQRKLKKH